MIPASHYNAHIPDEDGAQVHINHVFCDAGTDTKRRLYVKRSGGLALAYCHNCGQHGVMGLDAHKTKHIEELLRWANEEAAVLPEVLLPDDYISALDSNLWSRAARHWLDKYSLWDVSLLARYSIGYSPSMGRVILPVYDDADRLVFWQARRTDTDIGPKYLSSSSTTTPLKLFHRRASGPVRGSPYILIVEDFLSGMKCAEFTDVITTFGTSPNVGSLIELLHDPETPEHGSVVICYDYDKAGQDAAYRLQDELRLAGVPATSYIVPDSLRTGSYTSPKDLSYETLEKALS